jgi:hypothetical protein
VKRPYDGVNRIWHKSDPGTTAVYDFASINYIVDSDEGKKYYHFFKHQLMASEEHYYVSLLANWERTRKFVLSYDAMIVWNTWMLGKLNPSDKYDRRQSKMRSAHTSYLTTDVVDILRGLSYRGVFFARKFTSEMPDVLDAIDELLLFNKSSGAGDLILQDFQVHN